MITKMTQANMNDFNKLNEFFIISERIILTFENNVWQYRESLIDFRWPIEVFVHNLTSYKHFSQWIIKQYFLTDALDDFIGCNNRPEEIFIANTLAVLIQEFVLRTNGRWIGSSKWVIRALKNYDVKFTEEYVEAFDTFYKTGEKCKVVQLCEKVLDPYGGILFEGFSLGKENP